MIIGEDKNKIVNIVKPTLTQFQAIYSTLVEEYICPDSEQQGQWRLKVRWCSVFLYQSIILMIMLSLIVFKMYGCFNILLP